MNQLEKLKKSNPEVFLNRTLYSEVHRILESYTFKLSARREVLAFFPKKARLKKKSSDPPLPIFLMEPPRTPTPGKHSRSASDCPTPTAVMENE